MGFNNVPEAKAFCQAVNCDTPTAAIVATLAYGWVSLCASHAVLQIGYDNAITRDGSQ